MATLLLKFFCWAVFMSSYVILVVMHPSYLIEISLGAIMTGSMILFAFCEDEDGQS